MQFPFYSVLVISKPVLWNQLLGDIGKERERERERALSSGSVFHVINPTSRISREVLEHSRRMSFDIRRILVFS